MIKLNRLYMAHLEWLGLRRTLKGQEHRHFMRWLCRAYPSLVPSDLPGLTLLWQQCREIQCGSAISSNCNGLSMAILTRHIEAVTARYLALPIPQPTFADFLEKVIAKCPTEDALRRFLGSSDTNTI